ncbi:MAG: hypothetical protein HYY76_02615 [Acidobacteria bacterium]|nr:hypothetical protein [Acidobacteriota bacterium]
MTKLAVLDAGFIPRAPALPRSQDYAYLRARGLRHIERLAHRHWTDYNVHDPGITILELLCYVLTDLGLRAAYPMNDLLAPGAPPRGEWAANTAYVPEDVVAYRSGLFECIEAHTSSPGADPVSAPALWKPLRDFHLAHEVLVCKPVSFDDLRRLLIDIPGIRNAWVERHHDVTYGIDRRLKTLTTGAATESIELNGLFNVYIEYEGTYTDAGLLRPGGGEYVGGSGKGLEFEVLEDVRLESVTVYADTATTGDAVVVRLLRDGVEAGRKAMAITAARTALQVPVNFALQAGHVYRLDATGSTAKLHRTKPVSYPMPQAGGPVRILRGYAPGPPESGRDSYYFFYNWQVAHDPAGPLKADVRAAAIGRIHRNRNLCEDVVNVCDLIGEEVAICADLDLRPDADTDAVHAEILYRVYRHVSPGVPFRSLDELLARGKTVDEIFDGPLLDHGFIDDEELKAVRRRCEIRASDIVQILMDVDGVIAVKSLKLLKLSDPEHPEDWILPLSADRFRIAVFAPWGSKLTFYKRGLPYLTSRKAVEPLFAKKKAADLEEKLKVRRREVGVPAGEWRNASAYEPLINELPATYRVGRINVRPTDPVRQAQSRQLTAYLMFFEQLLANYLAQLSHLGDLFTWRDVDFRSYFTQQIANIAGLGPSDSSLDCSRQQGHATFLDALEAIIETPALAERRRLLFLEHLAARDAEGFDEYSALMRPKIRAALEELPAWAPGVTYEIGARVRYAGVEYFCLRAHSSLADGSPRSLPDVWRQVSRLVTHLRRFLEDYPVLSAGRGTGFDWRSPGVPTNVAGYQRRVYRLLDIDPVVRGRLAGHRLRISNTGTTEDPQWRFELTNEQDAVVFRSEPCPFKGSIEALLDLALRLGADAANYETDAGMEWLVQRCAVDKPPDRIGRIELPGSRAFVVAYFKRYAESEGFHVIEHILLRPRTTGDEFLPVQLEAEDECCPPVRDPYSFRVSVVLPSWSPRFRDMKFRHFVEDTLRREAPAHVYPRICWVNHEQMKQLEIALEDWQARLASLAREPGSCSSDDGTYTGRLPLPPTDLPYQEALGKLVARLRLLTNVYPLAQIHDCREADSATPQITLGNTSLGTL